MNRGRLHRDDVGTVIEAVCRQAIQIAVHEYVEVETDSDLLDEIELTADQSKNAVQTAGADTRLTATSPVAEPA